MSLQHKKHTQTT
jgi:hypothetical protein